METKDRFQAMAARMSTQLRVRGEDIAEVTERAGRRLPRRLRADAETMAAAEAMASNPKLARLVDDKRIARAERRLNRFLSQQNPARERWSEVLDTIAKIAFVLVTIVLAVFFFLLSRGYFD